MTSIHPTAVEWRQDGPPQIGGRTTCWSCRLGHVYLTVAGVWAATHYQRGHVSEHKTRKAAMRAVEMCDDGGRTTPTGRTPVQPNTQELPGTLAAAYAKALEKRGRR